MRPILASVLTAALLAGSLPACAAEEPVETRPPNSPYKPAFPEQTRAPRAKSAGPIKADVIATNLFQPWALEFLPDGRMLVTEKMGSLRLLSKDGKQSQLVPGIPAVDTANQGGLLDIGVDPDFARSRMVFFAYAERRQDGKSGATLASARLEDGPSPKLQDVKVIYRQTPGMDSSGHYGARIVFAADGTLFLAQGERQVPAGRYQSQDVTSLLGKVVRLNKDGSIPADNPFANDPKAKKEIWSYGHRNVQSAALQPGTNLLWTVEHGPMGGDELNQPEPGKNYGWPIIGYGIDYSGQKMPGGLTAAPGMEQPIYYWDPVIAPSGLAFYTGSLIPAWKGNLFIGGLATTKLVRLVLDGKKVVGEEWLLQDLGARIRDVVNGPDGALYVLTEEDNGRILRISPKT